MKIASEIRALSELSEVPCRLKNKAEVEKYLRDTLQKKAPKEQLQHEESVYKILGVIPQDFDYVNGVIEMYTDQIGGFYDPDGKYYAMAAWMPLAMQMPIAVHELTHALQDQHFDLAKLTEQKNFSGDELLAHSALIEGDATAVMVDYSRELSGQESIAKEDSISAFMVQNLTGALLSSSLSSAPTALQRMMIFPYVSGLHFVHHLLTVGGYSAVDKAFARPPQSTKEILHPEKYLKETTPSFRRVEDPLPEGEIPELDKQPVYTETLGEFVTSTLLGTYISLLRASEAADGWNGDRLALYKVGKGNSFVLVWLTYWQSENERKEFFDALVEAYEKRFGSKAEKSTGHAKFIVPNFGRLDVKENENAVRLEVRG